MLVLFLTCFIIQSYSKPIHDKIHPHEYLPVRREVNTDTNSKGIINPGTSIVKKWELVDEGLHNRCSHMHSCGCCCNSHCDCENSYPCYNHGCCCNTHHQCCDHRVCHHHDYTHHIHTHPIIHHHENLVHDYHQNDPAIVEHKCGNWQNDCSLQKINHHCAEWDRHCRLTPPMGVSVHECGCCGCGYGH